MNKLELITELASCQYYASMYHTKKLLESCVFDGTGGCYIPPVVLERVVCQLTSAEDARTVNERREDATLILSIYKNVIDEFSILSPR